jgi:Tol biopolymer transport system component/tRNA A-37 threonylcarbamoyl transferase component Bud32
MPLSPGERLGPYEIVSAIGKGGMGEVWKARDPRLGRDVAIKISAQQFTDRFEREARAIAALNHPNICTLFDVGPNYLVMEFVTGATLADRIRQGPIPFEEALSIAKQIADALDAAHEKNIVHRDLKPANVNIRPDGSVKVLDFGLAKSGETQEVTPDSPTMMTGTMTGIILGTAGYMSPEQARGQDVDKRADIWAFGVVLYEMVTGKRLFEGATVSDSLAAILKEEPDLTLAPEKTRRLLRRCLEKDPKRRLRDIGDAMTLLEVAPEPVHAASAAFRLAWFAVGAVGLVAMLLGAVAFIHFSEKPPVRDVVRFQIPAPEKSALNPAVIVSPDGRKLAFIATGPDSRRHVWVRPLDSLDARIVADVGGGSIFPFWSPDSGSIGFWTQSQLKKVEASGGSPQTLCDVTGTFGGGAWSRDGVIVFGQAGSGLRQVSADGGTPSPITTLDPARQEIRHTFPAFLPDGRHFVYLRISTNRENSGIFAGSLNAKPEQQSSLRIAPAQREAVYVPSVESSKNGYLLFMREETLMAQPFDTARMNLTGKPLPISEAVTNNNAYAVFSASSNGVLAYRSDETASTAFAVYRPVWYDRQGKVGESLAGDTGRYTDLSLSPDGTRVAVRRTDPQAAGKGGQIGNWDIWLHELARGVSTRLTFDRAVTGMPVWSPDGSSIVYASDRDGLFDLYRKPSSGAGNEESLLRSGENKLPADWSPDGRFLLYSALEGTRRDLWVLPLARDNRKPSLYLKIDYNGGGPAQFSPDGRFVAYTSNESGRNEVYVQPFPVPSGGKWMISKDGGSQPRWRRNGKELFYVSAEAMLMEVDVSLSPAFKAGIPRALFPVSFSASGDIIGTGYDVTTDGQRFLIDKLTTGAESRATAPPVLTVVLNWQSGLKK